MHVKIIRLPTRLSQRGMKTSDLALLDYNLLQKFITILFWKCDKRIDDSVSEGQTGDGK